MTSPADDTRDDALDELVHRADLDGLVRLVDARCEGRDWDGLRRIRDRSRAALRTGRQLWPAATLAEYRLALLAPPAWAGPVVDEGSGRFALGPLTEVVAQEHRWHEIRPHLSAGPHAVFVAHERVLRGDDVDVDGLPPVLDIPARLERWEPAYPLAVYRDATAEFPTPPVPTGLTEVDPATGATAVDDAATDLAVRQLVEPWTDGSNGRVDVVCVEGDLTEALGALGVRTARAVEVTAEVALAWLGWAGASGGAHGRRRGAATGRYGVWWLLAALGDLHDEWPPSPDAIDDLLADLRWWWWDAAEPVSGWRVQLAVEDLAEHVAWAMSARDER